MWVWSEPDANSFGPRRPIYNWISTSFSVRRQPRAAGKGVGHVATGLRTLFRFDHCEQWHRRDDSKAGERHRHGSIDIAMGAGVVALLTRWWTRLRRLPQWLRGLRLRMRVGWLKVEVFQLNCWLIKFKIYHYAIIFAWIFDCDSKTITKRVAGEAAEGLSYDDYDFNFVHNSLFDNQFPVLLAFCIPLGDHQFFFINIEYFIKEKREKYKKKFRWEEFFVHSTAFQSRAHLHREHDKRCQKEKSENRWRSLIGGKEKFSENIAKKFRIAKIKLDTRKNQSKENITKINTHKGRTFQRIFNK